MTGKASLSGEIFIQGSKKCSTSNDSRISDAQRTKHSEGMPQNFRCFLYGRDFEKSWCSDLVDDHDLYLDCSCADGTEIPAVYTGRMRSSIILAGAVLARNRNAG